MAVPFVCGVDPPPPKKPTDRGCPGCLSCALTSDDGGSSWEVGGVAMRGTRESSIVQVRRAGEHAGLYINSRYLGDDPAPGRRRGAFSEDGGSTYGEFSISNLTEPVTPHWTGIVAAVARLTLAGPGSRDRLVYSGPMDPKERRSLGLRVSEDEGHTWSGTRATLWSGPAGYSDLARLDDERLAVIFENGDTGFAERVSVCLVPTRFLLAG